MAQPAIGSPVTSAFRAFNGLATARVVAAPAAPYKLEFTYDTKPGNSLEIRGTASGMTWDAGKALKWNAGNRWTLELPAGTKAFQYKVVFVRQDGAFLFEEGLHNRTFDPNHQPLLKTPVFREPAAGFAAFAVRNVAAASAGSIAGTTKVRYAYLLPRVLEIRGNGPGMSWDVSRKLTTEDNKYWTFPTMPAGTEYKFGVADGGVFQYEQGPNRVFDPNSTELLKAPNFSDSSTAIAFGAAMAQPATTLPPRPAHQERPSGGAALAAAIGQLERDHPGECRSQ